MVLTTPVNACILSTKMHMDSCMRAYATVQKLLCHGSYCQLILNLARASCRLPIYLESCASIVQAVVCCPLLPPLLLCRPYPSPDAVHSRNPSKSTLAHDTVAAEVLHKYHSIIRVGAGLIQFVYGSHSRVAMGVASSRIQFWPFFRANFSYLAFISSACLR